MPRKHYSESSSESEKYSGDDHESDDQRSDDQRSDDHKSDDDHESDDHKSDDDHESDDHKSSSEEEDVIGIESDEDFEGDELPNIDFKTLRSILSSCGKKKLSPTGNMLLLAFRFFPSIDDESKARIYNEKEKTLYITLSDKYERSNEKYDYEEKMHDNFFYCDQTSEFHSFCDFLYEKFKEKKNVKLSGVKIIINQKGKEIDRYVFE